MKKSLKITALFLVVVLSFGFAVGCSSNNVTNSGGATPTPGGNSPAPNTTSDLSLTFKDIYTNGCKIAYVPLGTAAASAPAAKAAIEYATKYWDNIKVDIFDANYDLNQQIKLLNDCATQGYDAIILCPLDGAALNSTVAEIEAMGIPVITQNNTITGIHTASVRGDPFTIGYMQAQALHEKMGSEGKVVMLDVPSGNLATAIMGRGFEKYMEENTKWELLDYANIDAWSTENANTAMRDFLTMYDDIDAVWTAFDDMAIGAMQAIEAAGRGNEGIYIYGQEGTTSMLEYIKAGKVTGTVFSDVYDNLGVCVDMALYAIQVGITGTEAGFTNTPIINTSLDIVDSSNVDTYEYIKRW